MGRGVPEPGDAAEGTVFLRLLVVHLNSAAAALRQNVRPAMFTVRVQTYVIADVRLVFGSEAEWCGASSTDELVGSRADSKGVTIQVYRTNGRPQYAD